MPRLFWAAVPFTAKGLSSTSHGTGSGGFSSCPGTVWLAKPRLHTRAFGLDRREPCRGAALLAQRATCNEAGERRSGIFHLFSAADGVRITTKRPGKGKGLGQSPALHGCFAGTVTLNVVLVETSDSGKYFQYVESSFRL